MTAWSGRIWHSKRGLGKKICTQAPQIAVGNPADILSLKGEKYCDKRKINHYLSKNVDKTVLCGRAEN